MKVQPGSSLVNYLSVRDHRRIGKAEKQKKSVEKKRLSALKRHRTAAELLRVLLMHQGCTWKMTPVSTEYCQCVSEKEGKWSAFEITLGSDETQDL